MQQSMQQTQSASQMWQPIQQPMQQTQQMQPASQMWQQPMQRPSGTVNKKVLAWIIAGAGALLLIAGIIILVVVLSQPTAPCDRCGRVTSDLYNGDMFRSNDTMYCADCAREYYYPFDIQRMKLSAAQVQSILANREKHEKERNSTSVQLEDLFGSLIDY